LSVFLKLLTVFWGGYVRLISVCTMSVTCIVGLSRTVTRFPDCKNGHGNQSNFGGRKCSSRRFCELNLFRARPRCADFKNEAIFFLRTRPIVQTRTFPRQKWSFSKTLFKLEKFLNAGFAFSVERKHFENEAFRKRWPHNNPVIFLAELSSERKSKLTGGCRVLKLRPT